ncbi:MAG TPA: maleylacetate reductase [Gemmatimonadaceae bacterium]
MRFVHDSVSPRVVFGCGSISQVPAEIELLGCSRSLIIATPGRARFVAEIETLLGARAAAKFLSARVHVPADVAAEAEILATVVKADSVVAVGGGSAIGVAKAVALKTGAPIIAIPTTYSGSEMTPVWGLSDESGKRTGRDPRVMPRVVIYDPDLTVDLPIEVSVPSAFNAMAHCVEALYAPDAQPLTSMMAVLALQLFPPALRRIASAPRDANSREDALYAAMLAGKALASSEMGVHHKICHVLGGSFGLPHAQTHMVVLPHAAAFNRHAAAAEMEVIAASIGADDAPQGLYDLARELGAPMSLSALGMEEADLDRAAELVVEKPYPNPRPVTREAVRELLDNAFHGRSPLTVKRE